MDEVDRILIITLTNVVKCEIDENVKSLKEFSTDLIYQACTRTIRAVDSNRAFPRSLPAGLAQRVSACTAIATAIKELGYRGDVSYHQILYPNEHDIRKVLLFLVDLLPKDTDETTMSGFRETLRKVLENLQGQTWAPDAPIRAPNAFRSIPLQSPIVKANNRKIAGYEAKYIQQYMPYFTNTRFRCASIIEYNQALLAHAQSEDVLEPGTNPWEHKKKKQEAISQMMNDILAAHSKPSQQAMAQSLQDLSSGATRSQGPKSKFILHSEYDHEKQEVVPQQKPESEQELQQKRETEIEGLNSHIQQLVQELETLETEIQTLASDKAQVEAGIQSELEKTPALETERNGLRGLGEMLKDPEGSKKALNDLIGATGARLMNLAKQWEEKREPLVAEYRRLKLLASSENDDVKEMLAKIKEMREKMPKIIEDIRAKDERYKQLVEIYTGLTNRDLNRQYYTRRILDIVKNVKKQKVDINKILLDTRNVKKEINTISDTLGRVFAVTDEMIFTDAKDPKRDGAKQIYKLLAGLDEAFKNLVKFVEDAGAARNNILNLESKIDALQSRISALNLENIANDLKAVKTENAKLEAKIPRK